jgi:hypothetical protein
MFFNVKKIVSSFILIYFIFAQQIIAFTLSIFSFFSLYWLAVVLIVFLLVVQLPLTSSKYRHAFIFMVLCICGAMFNVFLGYNVIGALTRSFAIFYGFIGYVYLSERRVSIFYFDFFLILQYLGFYLTYFIYDAEVRKVMDEDLFGHSSSNTISISLSISLFFYYIVSYETRNIYTLFKSVLYSIVNLALIAIQGSRAGIVFSSLLLLLTFTSFIDFKVKRIYISLLFTIFLISFLVFKYDTEILEMLLSSQISGLSTYQDDIRGTLQASFFELMDIQSFLFGYKDNFDFSYGFTRTFNSFLDFWSRYGFLPFLVLVVYLIRRVVFSKYFSVPLFYFVPLMFYSLVESLWGGTLWDMLIFLLLFYGYDR